MAHNSKPPDGTASAALSTCLIGVAACLGLEITCIDIGIYTLDFSIVIEVLCELSVISSVPASL